MLCIWLICIFSIKHGIIFMLSPLLNGIIFMLSPLLKLCEIVVEN